jgi:aryl-alcohol dehydrogenase-like predicted oxidoreductase
VQFALANPAVQSVVIGARSTLEIDDLVAASEATVPNDCWAELADLGVVLA